MQTVLSLFVVSMQKAKHMYANCVNLSGRQFAKSDVCKKRCMQKAMYASGVMLQSQTACKKGVKLSCREYVQDVKINRKRVLKKKVQFTCRQYAKGVKLSCRQCAKDVTFSCRQRKRKTPSLVMLQTLCHKPPKVKCRQYAKKKSSAYFLTVCKIR